MADQSASSGFFKIKLIRFNFYGFRDLLKVVLEPAMNPFHARALWCVIWCKGDFATTECGADARGLSLTPRADDDDKLSTSLSSFILRKADFTGPMRT